MSKTGQRDDVEDGYGNICDGDVDQDCLIGIPDVVAIFNAQPDGAPWSPKENGAFDVNEGNLTGIPDVVDAFNQQPGVPRPERPIVCRLHRDAGHGRLPMK